MLPNRQSSSLARPDDLAAVRRALPAPASASIRVLPRPGGGAAAAAGGAAAAPSPSGRPAAPRWRGWQAPVAAAAALLGFLRRELRYAQAARELAQMDERMLRDLGIESRAQIDYLVRYGRQDAR